MWLVREPVITHVVYERPDHRWLLQEFTWETEDYVPDLPRVRRFLDYWRRELDGPISRVYVVVRGRLLPYDLRVARVVGSC